MTCTNCTNEAATLQADRDTMTIVAVCGACGRRPSDTIRQYRLPLGDKIMKRYLLETKMYHLIAT